MLMQTGSQPVFSQHGLLATVAWDLGQGLQYALEGSVFNAGSAIQWVRDELGLIASAAEIDRLAALVPDTAGVQVVPAFTGLGAPYWDMHRPGTDLWHPPAHKTGRTSPELSWNRSLTRARISWS
jgi:glycerol kinase